MAYTAIDDPEAYFQVELYTGTGSELSTTFDGDTDMQPNFVWSKNRDQAEGHKLFDSVRGATKFIMTNNNDTETTTAETLKSFDSDGVTIGTDADMNTSSEKNVLWCWKESATAGFDIIAYTGTGSNMDVSHNLSAVPDFFVIKNLEVDQAWRAFHKNMTTADPYSTRMVLSEDGAATTSALGLDADPTSSVINIGTGTGCTNASGEDMIVYAWTSIQGFSKFGSYLGNGNADGTFVYTGFRPAFIITKRTDSAGSWGMFDNKRSPSNVVDDRQNANLNEADQEHADNSHDFLSNGFKVRTSDNQYNNSSGTYVYAAFAEAPFVNSNGVPGNAR